MHFRAKIYNNQIPPNVTIITKHIQHQITNTSELFLFCFGEGILYKFILPTRLPNTLQEMGLASTSDN